MQFTINERGGKADREDQEGEQTGAGGAARNGRTTRTWFSIPSAGEPALVADQQLVLYRRRIGLLECPSVVHPDDGDERRRGTGSMCCERLCEGLGLRLYWTKGSRCGERAADGGEELFCVGGRNGQVWDRSLGSRKGILQIPLRSEKIVCLSPDSEMEVQNVQRCQHRRSAAQIPPLPAKACQHNSS